MMRMAIAALLATLIFALPAATAPADDHLVVPGVRIGKWTLQMSIDDLTRMNGPASRQISVMGGQPPYIDLRSSNFTKYEWSLAHLHAFTSDAKHVKLLRMLSDSPVPYKTKEGIGSRSTPEQIRRAYGAPTATTKNASDTTLIYDKIGFFVTLDDTGMSDLGVFQPGEAKTIWTF